MSDFSNSQLMVTALGARLGVEQVVETHSAWVLLTPALAYKIKRPVDFGFLDFSTLEKRRQCCEQELLLNRRFSQGIYLKVEAITGEFEAPRLGGEGPVLDYTVVMRRFSQGSLLATLAKEGKLEVHHAEAFAEALGHSHFEALSSTSQGFGSADTVSEWVMANFATMEPLCTASEVAALLSLKRFSEERCDGLRGTFDARLSAGMVKDCHGDLHLNNVIWEAGRVQFFDCIEFNDALRWIDTMSELAFALMDIAAQGYGALRWQFLNTYLAITGDYAGLGVLRFYLVYRALVRAKVALLRRDQDPDHGASYSEDFNSYLRLAQQNMRGEAPFIILMHGLSGSGKSVIAKRLANDVGAIHLRSDVERKRLVGLAAQEQSGSAIDEGIYAPEFSRQVYEHLCALSEQIVNAEYSVIVDAAFLKAEQRLLFKDLAARLNVSMAIVHCEAPENMLRQRIEQRLANASDASEADGRVLTRQMDQAQPLSVLEQALTININTDSSESLQIKDLQRLLR